MFFDYAYASSTSVDNSARDTGLSFAPDISRAPTYFRGELRHNVAFREAISTLHSVVVSDLRFQPKDKTAYKAWAAQRELEEWGLLQAEIAGQHSAAVARIEQLQTQLKSLNEQHSQRMKPFYEARRKYFDYLYQKEKDAWWVLDPVITVHPDELFFECFSQDESSYGRLSVDYQVFQNIGEFACGTTNIDYSEKLYQEFQKIRSYKTTHLVVDPDGFNLETTHEDDYREVKIDLPDSWVRGFLQVNSAMTLPATQVTLHPLDVHNFCFVLRRKKEQQGPRAMRFLLTPDAPVEVLFEPWNLRVKCARSIYHGDEAQEIRVWGRRRLLMLERLVPLAKRFTVHLLGTGLPSFYVADLGNMWFTLGLSGWTANDWSSAGHFDLMAPRAEVDRFTRSRVFKALSEVWYEKPDALAQQLDMDRAGVLGALGQFTQAGRAIFDLNKQVYRLRELSREPLPMDTLRYANEREAAAHRFIESQAVTLKSQREDAEQHVHIHGTVNDKQQKHSVMLHIDSDERLLNASCTCYYFKHNKLYKGPCEHMLALRLIQAHSLPVNG